MIKLPRLDSISGPTLRLVGGRTVGFVAVFAIPVVLVVWLLAWLIKQ